MLLRRMPKPVIAALRGPVAGSGVVLAAACDLRIASRTTKFKLAFASAGRCGDPGGSFLLTQLIGSARAREVYLLDEPINAERALDIGSAFYGLYIHPDECVDCGACEPVCPVEAIFYEDDTPEQWKDYYTANVDFFNDLGSPGGAAKMGVIEKDHPLIAALPPQNQE